MIPCKGIHRIICTRKTDCPRGVKKNAQPDCISCPDALTQIIDLEGKIIYEYQVKEERHKGTEAPVCVPRTGRQRDLSACHAQAGRGTSKKVVLNT